MVDGNPDSTGGGIASPGGGVVGLLPTNGGNGGSSFDIGTMDTSVPAQNRAPGPLIDQGLLDAGIINGNVYRGFMTSSSITPPPTYTFYFQYNPTEINFAYDFDSSMLTAGQVQQNGGVPILVAGASISFKARIDRSTELASLADNDPQGPGVLGAMHDIRVLQKLVGSLDNGTLVSPEVVVAFTSITGLPANSTQTSVTQTGLNFAGYTTSIQVAFTQFNHMMIPTRADVDIILQKVYDPKNSTDLNGTPGTTSKTFNKPATGDLKASGSDIPGGQGGRTYNPNTGKLNPA